METFDSSPNLTVYHLPGTTDWGPTFAWRPTAPWVLPQPLILTSTAGVGFGGQPDSFGFRVSWATNAAVVVEASTSLASRSWSAVATNLLADGWTDFRDAEWASHPSRFYRVRSP